MVYSDILEVLEKAGSDGRHSTDKSTAAQLTSSESKRQGPL